MRGMRNSAGVRRVRRGQSAIEYVILIVTAVAAVTWIFPYVRSALAHRMKTGADAIGHGMQYP